MTSVRCLSRSSSLAEIGEEQAADDADERSENRPVARRADPNAATRAMITDPVDGREQETEAQQSRAPEGLFPHATWGAQVGRSAAPKASGDPQ